MASNKYTTATEAIVNLLNHEDPPLEKIIEYHNILCQKKNPNKKANLIPKIAIYIELRQSGYGHSEAFYMAHETVRGCLYGKYSKTNIRLHKKLAERKSAIAKELEESTDS